MGQLELIGFAYRGGSECSGKPDDRLRNAQCAPDGRGARSKKRARARAEGTDPTQTWALEPHVCRHCFGRLISQPAAGRTRYVCSNCGAEDLGDGPDVLCACGLALRNHGPSGGMLNAGLRCQPNPSPSPEFPSLFVAAEPKSDC